MIEKLEDINKQNLSNEQKAKFYAQFGFCVHCTNSVLCTEIRLIFQITFIFVHILQENYNGTIRSQ